MPSEAELFLSMFREEIKDSLSGVQYLANSVERKFKNEEITNYVYNENNTFLAQEIVGLRRFLAFLDSISPDVKTTEDIALLIGNVVKQRTKDYEDPGAVYEIVNKKMAKTLKYLKLQQI